MMLHPPGGLCPFFVAIGMILCGSVGCFRREEFTRFEDEHPPFIAIAIAGEIVCATDQNLICEYRLPAITQQSIEITISPDVKNDAYEPITLDGLFLPNTTQNWSVDASLAQLEPGAIAPFDLTFVPPSVGTFSANVLVVTSGFQSGLESSLQMRFDIESVVE
jgi:hypothetical protein